MRRRMLLVVGFTLLAVILGFTLAEWMPLNTSTKSENSSVRLLEVKAEFKPRVDYTISTGNTVLRSKTGDPLTLNFYKMIFNIMGLWMWYCDTGNTTFYLQAVSGSTYCAIDTESGGLNPVPYIAVGNGTGTASASDYKMFNQVALLPASVSVSGDNASYVFTVVVKASWNATQSINISEIGFMVKTDADPWSDSVKEEYFLLAHDNVDPPLTATPGVVYEFTYTFTLPYNPSGPLTRNFYHMVIDYVLGYKASTGNTTMLPIKRVDGALVSVNTVDMYGKRDSPTHLFIASSQPPAPVFEAYTVPIIGYIVISTFTGACDVTLSFNPVTLRVRGVFGFTNDTVIGSLGIVSYAFDPDILGVLYAVFPVSITASKGSFMVVEVVIQAG